MNRALIASAPDSVNSVEQLLRSMGFTKISCAASGNEARRLMMSETEPELIVVCAPLTDEFGHELAVSAAEYTSAEVLLLCDGNISEEIADTVSAYGVTVLPKSTERTYLSELIRELSEHHTELHGTEKENADILTKIDEMRIINRAKCKLMQYLGFTEHQAHKYLEKQAMNNRQTRKEAAEKILAQYDT